MKSGLYSTPFLHNFKDSVPHGGGCLYGQINLSLVQARQQFSLGLSQSSISVRGGRTRPRVGFQFNVQKQPVVESSRHSLEKKPHSDTRTESHQSDNKSSGGDTSDSKKKGNHGGQCSWCLTVYNFIICICCADWYTSPYFRSMEKHFKRFVLNMVKCHHLQLRAKLPLFHNFTGSALRLLQPIILLSRRKYMSF